MKQREISLYIHIPFCKSKCYYCDFLSAPADGTVQNAYLQALLCEVRSYRNCEVSQRKVKTIFIGGGTPSILKADDITAVLNEIKSVFHISQSAWREIEITIEMNPGTVTEEKCRAYHAIGINRVSIGLQSTCDRELQKLGRIHNYEMFLATYQRVRDAGFNNVNIDLMSALPGQTISSYRESLEKTVALAPEHISAYSLIIEEGTPFYETYAAPHDSDALVDEDTEREMYKITNEILAQAGYYRYEISNYAKRGQECRHNIVYWKRGDYLGIGLGASSLVDHVRYKNNDNLEHYISYWSGGAEESRKLKENGKSVVGNKTCMKEMYGICRYAELCKLTTKEEMEEIMFLGLRMMEGISVSGFSRYFGQDIMSVYGETIHKFVSMGMLEWKNGKSSAGSDRLRMTQNGIDVSNVIFADFLLD